MIAKGKNFLYKKMVLRQLYFSKELSCAELSKQIKKSIPVCNKLLEELISDGFVIESGFGPSSGGRRPLVYSLIPDVMYVVSVAMDQFITRIVMMDTQNKYIVDIEEFDLPLANNVSALEILATHIKKFIQRSGVETEKIVGIGIGMPGFVNSKEGINYTYFHKDKDNNENVVKYISKKLDLPVYIDNDSSLVGLAELKFGGAQNAENVMVINVGWGIGLGLILNGKLFRGEKGLAGEFSHIPLFINNKLCGCGKSGCLETEASLAVIIEKAKKGIEEGTLTRLDPRLITMEHPESSFEAILAAAKRGDQFCVKMFSDAAYDIGRGIAILIHILSPELVILSGRGSLAGNILEVPVWQALNEHCIPRLVANTKVQSSTLGYDAELIGAAALVMENFDKGQHENLFSKRLTAA
jgi:predicted NBD/HSP70 family sugar kinase